MQDVLVFGGIVTAVGSVTSYSLYRIGRFALGLDTHENDAKTPNALIINQVLETQSLVAEPSETPVKAKVSMEQLKPSDATILVKKIGIKVSKAKPASTKKPQKKQTKKAGKKTAKKAKR
jgi:hypothetical protein